MVSAGKICEITRGIETLKSFKKEAVNHKRYYNSQVLYVLPDYHDLMVTIQCNLMVTIQHN